MKETLERAAEELLNAATRLQELAQQPQPRRSLDLQNLSPEDEEKLGHLFNAWTQKNICEEISSFEERLNALGSDLEEFPQPYDVSSAVDKVEYFDPEDVSDNKEAIENLRDQFEELASQLSPLTTLAELLNLELLINTIKTGIEASKKEEQQATAQN